MARMKLAALAGAVLLAGCSEAPPRVLHYSAFDVVIADQYTVDRLCGTRYTDSGSYIRVDQHIAGCFDDGSKPPRIVVDRSHPEVLTHELAHWDGHDDPERDGYNW